MNKRVLVIVGLALIIAVSGGVVALNSGNNNDKNKADASSSTASEVDNGSGSQEPHDNTPDNGSSEPFVDGTTDVETNTDADFIEETQVVEAPTTYDGTVEPSVPYDEQIISDTMSVKFVVDNRTGAEASPRVVFGADYESCYIAFSPNKTFEMCIDPTSGSTRTGRYEIVNDIVSVTYDDGTGSEFDILVDEMGNITHVIVNYGDYSVYFG